MNAETSNPGQSSDFRAVLAAGVVASLVFQTLEIALIPLAGGGSPWGPARMIAAMVMGPKVLPPPADFNLTIVTVAFAVDIVLAVIYAAVLSRLIRRWALLTGLLAGAIFGAALYVVNFYGFTRLFPWFEMGRNGVTLLTHIIFSMTVVWVYQSLRPSLKE